MNLLTNPSFNDGFHRQDDIAEITVPDGWHLYWIDKEVFPGGGQEALRPESMVWYKEHAPEHEKSLFFLDGDYCWKVFKPFSPVYLAVTQLVSGLTPGATYRFNTQVFPDIVIRYEGGQKVRPDDIWHAEARVGWSAPDTPWPHAQDGDVNWDPWFNMTKGNFKYGEYNDIWLEFVAPASGEVRVWLECKAKWGGATTENNWFMDAFALTPVGGAPEPEPGPAPGPEPEPTPPTTPVPGRGAPRVQYERTYLLLPEGLAEDMVEAAARVARAKGITLGFSPDDAGVGDLDKRRVICVNPDQIGTGLSQDWYDEHYPGVQFIAVRADEASVLETALQAVI